MNKYKETVGSVELKGTPESTRESYSRRMKAFWSYMQDSGKPIEDMNEEDIQQ